MGDGLIFAIVPLLVIQLLLVLPLMSRQREAARVPYRLTEVERRLDLVMAHLGLTDEGPDVPEVREHLRAGRLVAAVRAYRQATGVGLAEAKRAVDAQLARQE